MAALTYYNNIPQPTDQPSVSQPQILTNFASIQSLVDQDHIDFAATNAGKHNQVTFPLNSNSPTPPTFLSGEIGLYSLLGSTGVNELYITKNVGGGGSASLPLTASTLSVTAAPAAASEWYSLLPSGIVLKGGGLVAQSPLTHLFPVAASIPVFTQVLTVLLTVNSATATGFVTVSAVGPTGFTFALSAGFPGGATIQYLAIGY